MGFDLKVRIGGVCGFVPQKPIDPNAADNLMRVLLAQTQKNDQIGGFDLKQHHAEFWFDEDDLDPSWPTPPPYTDNGGTFIWSLAKDDLTIEDAQRPQTESGLAIVSGQRDSAHQWPQGADNPKDYSWLADLGKIATGAGKVNPLCFTDPAQLLSARLTLDYGNLSVKTIYKEPHGYQVWDFKQDADDLGATYRQALATWLEARIPIFDDHVDIVSSNFPNQPSKPQLLRLKPPSGHREVKVDLVLLSGERKERGFPHDDSFRVLYRLSDFNGKLRVPTRPTSSMQSVELLSPFTTFCPGGGYDPYP